MNKLERCFPVDNGNEKKERILEKYYYTIANPAAFSSPQKLHKVLEKIYPGLFSQYYIQKWLNGIDAYSVQKQE